MKYQNFYLFFYILATSLLFSSCATAQKSMNPGLSNDDSQIIKSLDNKFNEYADVAHQIWTYAELGYIEYKSSKLLQDKLSEAGFDMKVGVAEMPTAFAASYGSGKPVIGIPVVAIEPEQVPACPSSQLNLDFTVQRVMLPAHLIEAVAHWMA